MLDLLEQAENKPKTVVLECRVDIRTLASILRYMNEREVFPANRAQLARASLEGYMYTLANNGHLIIYESTVQALNYLNLKGFHFGKVGQKGNMNLAKQLQNESINNQGRGIDPNVKVSDADKKLIESFMRKESAEGTSGGGPAGGIAGLPPQKKEKKNG